jgi:glutaredoxin
LYYFLFPGVEMIHSKVIIALRESMLFFSVFSVSSVVKYPMNKPPDRILLYATRQCSHCRQAKAFFKKHKIPFTEWDVERNQRAWKEFQRLGGRGVPLILVGKQQFRGFDSQRLTKALRQAGFHG